MIHRVRLSILPPRPCWANTHCPITKSSRGITLLREVYWDTSFAKSYYQMQAVEILHLVGVIREKIGVRLWINFYVLLCDDTLSSWIWRVIHAMRQHMHAIPCCIIKVHITLLTVGAQASLKLWMCIILRYLVGSHDNIVKSTRKTLPQMHQNSTRRLEVHEGFIFNPSASKAID